MHSQSDSKVFSVRIVSIDYYMAPPIPGFDICYSSFQGDAVKEVPVIRIYGSTPAGQKTCLHVHRALPYLYVPCSDISLNPDQEGNVPTHDLSLQLESALKLKGSSASKRQHVHGCSIVRARRFYGYHSLEELFVKIYFYHTHDVARAATLLLAGAVQGKTLQPYESHIPFILQFLVDYNLYGMGHVHISKMKFRHPMPDTFFARGSDYNTELRQEIDGFTPEAADFQADPSTCASHSSQPWTSSTVPADWMWHLSSDFDTSLCPQIHHFKHQSVCELEGDATINDILNQQSKMYTSLSQTHTDVRMVQSLIPIWEEEYERTGMHQAAISSDTSKPLPEDVLKILSLGFDFENRLAELCSEAEEIIAVCENDVKPVPSAPTSTGKEVLVADAHAKSDSSDPKFLEDRDVLEIRSEQGLPHEHEMDVTCPNDEDAFLGSLSADDVQYSEKAGSLNMKAAGVEALGLLNWLASSQAAEDINSDDELVRETILSPLLPTTKLDKVLEKANMDYENESQKECQDILDSVEELIDFGALKERATHTVTHGQQNQTSANKIIPQMDGSSDDPCMPADTESCEDSAKTDFKKTSECQVSQESSQSFSRKQKSTKSVWGRLPFSITKKASKEFANVGFDVSDTFVESREGIGASSAGAKELGSYSNVSTKYCDPEMSNVNEKSGLARCSVRDLMRRKRFYRPESLEAEPNKAQKVLPQAEEETNIIFFPADSMDEKMTFPSLDLTPSLTQQPEGFNEISEPTHSDFPVNSASTPSYCTKTYHAAAPQSSAKEELPYNIKVDNPDSAVSSHLKTYHAEESDLGAATTKTTYSNAVTHKSGSSSSFQLLELDRKDKRSAEVKSQEGGSNCPDAFIHSYDQKAKSALKLGCEMSYERLAMGMDATEDTKSSSGEQVENADLDGLGCSFPLAVSVERETEGLIGMTLSKKPPTLDWNNEASEYASSPHNICFPFPRVYEENYKGPSGRASKEILPYFTESSKGQVEVKNKCFEDNKGDTCLQEGIMGVPTHYLNDGSCLYQLAPALSPPSSDAVHAWLLGNKACVSGVANTKVAASPSKKGSCDPQTRSQSHSDEQVDHQNNLNLDAEMNVNRGNAFTKGNMHSQGSHDISQISAPDGNSRPTPLSQIGFCDPASIGAGQQLTLLSIEVQAECRGYLRPDPKLDPINVVALAFQTDNSNEVEVYVLMYSKIGSYERIVDGISGCKMLFFPEEKQLFNHFMKILGSSDPDIIMGWDIQGGSLGFLAERAAQFGIRLLNNISRTPSVITKGTSMTEISEKGSSLHNNFPEVNIDDINQVEEAIIEDEWGRTHASGVHVGGRVVLNVWRLMRGELKLNLYTAEAVAEAALRRKIPLIPHQVLTKWFLSGPGVARFRCIDYVIQRAKLNLELMIQLDMINRTSELARVFGIEFFSVLSRGSQYRVESMFLRLAHSQNYLAISPGNQQVASQPAMECLPLVMEPESGFYADPVVVLDFQSLYPSMIIAYNLCYCTCLGKVTPSMKDTLGVSSFSPDPHVLKDLKSQILLTPNGVMYVPSKVRKGVLPRLLEEILSTRIMVKQAMKKLAPSKQVLHRIFNARQLALKLIANVTYGYTAAGFSGRMPCAELADSIVQCGRRTLEKAISYVNANEKWKAKVVYGDTDSMFVLLEGRTVKEAHKIGHEIAASITSMNPSPVVLKMEKVYHPCFLLTKKRYVGYSYEDHDQIKPVFDAKGIETVRRDTCAAVAKTMEQSLRIFFEHQEISMVKEYLQRQFTRILTGRVSVQDFVFAKEVRLGTYSARDSSLLPPSAIVATKAMRTDPRAEPRYGERVAYVVIHGEPGARLVDMVIDPLDLLAIDSPYRLNDLYYINKQIIPALQRVFGLVGADLNMWFLEMPRPVRQSLAKRPVNTVKLQRTRIDNYYLSKHCILCGELVQASAHFCNKCLQKESVVATAITGRTSKLEKEMHHLLAICRHCGGGDWIVEPGVKCTSLACSVFYERRKVQKELQGLSAAATDNDFYPKCMIEWF